MVRILTLLYTIFWLTQLPVVVVLLFCFVFLTFGQCCLVGGVLASPRTCNLYIPGSTPREGISCVHFFYRLRGNIMLFEYGCPEDYIDPEVRTSF